jgi:hypothetical protein
MNLWNTQTPTKTTKPTNQDSLDSRPRKMRQSDRTRLEEEQIGGFEYVDSSVETDEVETDETDYPPMKTGYTKTHARKQIRRSSLSVACSEEEARILRKAALDKGMTFSNWARKVLFRSAGKRIPKRPK